MVASVTSALPTPWRYQGRMLESAAGTPDLYDFQARSYNPALGTFTSLDSHLGSAQNTALLNGYLYANANPATLVDPDGHCSMSENMRADSKCLYTQADQQSFAESLTGSGDMNKDVYESKQTFRGSGDMNKDIFNWKNDTTSAAYQQQLAAQREKEAIVRAQQDRTTSLGMLNGTGVKSSNVCNNPVCAVTNTIGGAAGGAASWVQQNAAALGTAAVLIGAAALCVGGALETAAMSCLPLALALTGGGTNLALQEVEDPGHVNPNDVFLWTLAGAGTGLAPGLGLGTGGSAVWGLSQYLFAQETSDRMDHRAFSPGDYAFGSASSMVPLKPVANVVWSVASPIIQWGLDKLWGMLPGH